MTRDNAIKILESILFLDIEKDEALKMAIESLKHKQGEWIIYNPIHMHSTCSCCGYYNAINPYYEYCPNCGAYMRKILPKH